MVKEKYDVYFEQVNQIRIPVIAESEGEARAMARAEWREAFNGGHIISSEKRNKSKNIRATPEAIRKKSYKSKNIRATPEAIRKKSYKSKKND